MNYQHIIESALTELGLAAADVAVVTINHEIGRVIVLTTDTRKFITPIAGPAGAPAPRRTKMIKDVHSS